MLHKVTGSTYILSPTDIVTIAIVLESIFNGIILLWFSDVLLVMLN